jgi:hypothetical protein
VFQLLGALVAADPLMANEVHRTDLPRNVLDSLPQAMATALTLPSRQSQSACIIIESQLGLLQVPRPLFENTFTHTSLFLSLSDTRAHTHTHTHTRAPTHATIERHAATEQL